MVDRFTRYSTRKYPASLETRPGTDQEPAHFPPDAVSYASPSWPLCLPAKLPVTEFTAASPKGGCLVRLQAEARLTGMGGSPQNCRSRLDPGTRLNTGAVLTLWTDFHGPLDDRDAAG